MKILAVSCMALFILSGCNENPTPIAEWSLGQELMSGSLNETRDKLAVLLERDVVILPLDADGGRTVFQNVNNGNYRELCWSGDACWLGGGMFGGGAFARMDPCGVKDDFARLDLCDGGLHVISRGKRSIIYEVSGSANNGMIATAHGNGEITLWDAVTGEAIRSFGDYDTELFALAVTPDGRTVYSGDGHNTLKSWDLSSGTRKTSTDSPITIFALKYEDETGDVLCAGSGGVLYITDGGLHLKNKIKLPENRPVLSIESWPEGNLIICGLTDGYVAVLGHDGENMRVMKLHSDDIREVAFVNGGKNAITLSKDGEVKLWDVSKEWHTSR